MTTPERVSSSVSSDLRAMAFEHSEGAFVITDWQGRIIDWNLGAERMFGWARAEVIGRSVTLIHTPDQASKSAAEIHAQAVDSGRWSGEFTFVRKDQSRGLCLSVIVPLRPAAEPILLHYHRDITAHQQIEWKLSEERLLLQTLINAIPDLIFCKDRGGRYLLRNTADQELGVGGENYLGRTVFEMPGTLPHAERYHADDLKVIETGQPVSNREEPFTKLNGETGWFLTSKYPIRNSEGEIIGLVGIARDISARKEAEQKLADEQRLLRTLIDAIPDLIFFKDLQGRHLAVNVADQNFFGVSGESLLGGTVFDWPIPPEIAQQYYADDRQVLETGQPVIDRDEPYATADGREGRLLTSKYPLRDESGKIYGLVGIARDVTEFKRATEELERTQKRLVSHVENSPMAVIEWRTDFRVERWTGQAENLFGWKSEEVVGKHFNEWSFVYPADAEKVDAIVRRLIDGTDQHNVCQNRNLSRDGKVIHCLWHNSVLRDDHGEVISVLSLVQDMSEQMLAEQTIREHEQLYHTLMEATDTGYVHFDEFGRVVEANEEFLRLTGRKSLVELVGQSIVNWTASHDGERAAREYDLGLRAGFIRNLELDYVTPEGRISPVEINAKVRQTSQGRRMVAFCRDISGRRKAEAERQAFERQLQETQKLESLGLLAGGIAHDFNNLLTGVLGNAGLARMKAGAQSELQPFLEQVEVAATRAADLCRQMLAYSGKGNFVVSRLDLNAAVEETAQLLHISISKKVSVHYSLAADVPAIIGDLTQIRQVIMNLVINAAEAIGERPGDIHVSTRSISIERGNRKGARFTANLPEGEYVCLSVRDNGQGMPPSVRDRIFEPFFTTKITGRGLGLAAVLGIVRGHKGALNVESTLGRGTCFEIFLPRAEGPVGTQVGGAASCSPEWRGKERVLVVDDEETVRITAARMLEALGFEVVVADDGRSGVEAFAAADGKFGLVLLDLTMPAVDGDEALRQMRQCNPKIRTILMSGFDENEVLARFAGQEVSGFLQKPFRLAALQLMLQEILAPSSPSGSL